MIVSPKHTIAGEYLYVANSCKHGLGVYAAAPLEKDTVIHVCPVLLIPNNQLSNLDNTSLSGYVFTWDDTGDMTAFALGVGSLFNHSKYPNVRYSMHPQFERDYDTGFLYTFNAICFRTNYDILENDELTIDYSGGGAIDLWFDPID